MNAAELRYGARNSQHPDRHTKDVEAFLEPIVVLPFDGEAVTVAAQAPSARHKRAHPLTPGSVGGNIRALRGGMSPRARIRSEQTI
jgi:predicted nucleic acid-binding protein